MVVEDVREHEMHGETFAVSVGELQRIVASLESQKRLVVVGTTSSRTLESLYWCGVKKLLESQKIEEWGRDIKASSQSKLKLPLLTRDTNRILNVNFDPDLVRLLREVRYFLLLGLARLRSCKTNQTNGRIVLEQLTYGEI